MKQSFTIQREAVAAGDPSALRAEIIEAIGSEAEAAGILRSLERMGTDPTIEFFEISPVTGRRTHAGPVSNTWRVHADRGISEEEQSAV
ncbi:MAG TPA: hypothetical protein VHG09_04510 [Longimicrobiales bacterium]|nr:hypothetical protein [Longimicrobiales bacterium]